MAKDTFTCFQCKQPVLKIEAKKDSTERNEKVINKYFHSDCYKSFLENKEEWKELDKVCQYVKNEILQYKSNQRVPKHLVSRLQALKSGQEYGITKNSKVYGSKDGYSYDVILKTFKAKKFDIINGINNSSKFQNDGHKIDYIMVIIINNINDILRRIEAKKESDKRLDKMKIEIDEGIKYTNTKINNNKVANKLSDMW